MTWLIFGAGGMLAHALTDHLRCEGVPYSALTEKEADITDADAVQRAVAEYQPAVIVNCAAYTAVDACETNRDLAFAVNADGPQHLADAARREDALLVHVSTDYVFDGKKSAPYTEDDAPAPLSAYGESKLAGEEAVRRTGGRWLIVRSCALYGRHGRNFVDIMAHKARAGETVQVVTDQVTQPTPVSEVSRAIHRLVDRDATGLYHVATEGECSWYECARAVYAARGASPDKVEAISAATLNQPAQRPAYSVLDTTRHRTTTDARLPHWETALTAYLGDTPAPEAA